MLLVPPWLPDVALPIGSLRLHRQSSDTLRANHSVVSVALSHCLFMGLGGAFLMLVMPSLCCPRDWLPYDNLILQSLRLNSVVPS